jgi:glycosyltransferase involved in cell wall biosynthesis
MAATVKEARIANDDSRRRIIDERSCETDSSPANVAVICGAGIVSGKEIMALELGDGLRAKGARIVYVTSLWGDGDFSRRLSRRAIPFYRMRLGFISASLTLDAMWMTADQLMRLPKLVYDYARFLRREKPKRVIHTNWHHVLILWPFLKPGRDIYWAHEVLTDSQRQARFFRALARRMQCFVAVSAAASDGLRRIGIAEAKISVIRNGLGDPAAQTPPRARETTGGDIGIVGQIAAWKGHDDMLEAFAMIEGRHRNAQLHIFGDHDREFVRGLVERAEAGGIAQRIVWHGYFADRSKIYSLIDMCVIPSRVDESFGLTALEAAFFGLPVIASRKGGLPEIVVDGETGFLVDARSPTQLADRLDRLLGDPELRRRMGAAARQRATRHFSRERFIDDFTRLLAD